MAIKRPLQWGREEVAEYPLRCPFVRLGLESRLPELTGSRTRVTAADIKCVQERGGVGKGFWTWHGQTATLCGACSVSTEPALAIHPRQSSLHGCDCHCHPLLAALCADGLCVESARGEETALVTRHLSLPSTRSLSLFLSFPLSIFQSLSLSFPLFPDRKSTRLNSSPL